MESSVVKISTVYKQLELLGAKNVAFVTQKLKQYEEFQDGEKVIRRELRQREEIFKNHLLTLGVRHIPFSEEDLAARGGELRKKGAFDVCVITGEPFYQLLRLESSSYSVDEVAG